MPRPSRHPRIAGTPRHVLAVVLLAVTSLAAPAGAQGGSPVSERRVIVWRGAPGEEIALETKLGRRGFLGVALVDLTEELRSFFGVPEDRGVLISSVVKDSPAFAAGLRVGDVLTALDGRPVREVMGFQLAIAKRRDGDEVEIECRRGGETLRLRPVLEVRDRSQLDLAPLIGHQHAPGAPLAVELHTDSAAELELDSAWVEDLVDRLDRDFADASVLDQLEAMRVERRSLQEKLDRMEERLRQLEAELSKLTGESR